MPEAEDFSEREKLDLERESIGLYISGHPYDQYESEAEPYLTCPIGDLGRWRSQQPAVTAGLLSNVSEKYSKSSGNPYGTAVFEDNNGTVDALIFGNRWTQFKPILQKGGLYFLRGRPREDRGTSLFIEDIFTLEEYKEKLERRTVITIESDGCGDDFYEGMFAILKKHPGKCEILLKLVNAEETTVSIIRRIRVDDSQALKDELAEYSNGLIHCK